MSCADSLRLVQGVLDVNEIKSMWEELRKLREENALLKKETFNEFVTRQGPPASTGTSSSHAAEIEVAQA